MVNNNNILDRIEELAVETGAKKDWFETTIDIFFDDAHNTMCDFGLGVYSLLIEDGYIRDNLTTKNCKSFNSSLYDNIINSMLHVREEYNGELDDKTIDDDTEDFSDYHFGEMVLTVIHGRKEGYPYPNNYSYKINGEKIFFEL